MTLLTPELLLRAYAGPGAEVLYSRHGFLMYPIGAQSVGATPVLDTTSLVSPTGGKAAHFPNGPSSHVPLGRNSADRRAGRVARSRTLSAGRHAVACSDLGGR